MRDVIEGLYGEGDSIGIHIDYRYLQASDLNWIFGIIKTGLKEVRLQIIEEEGTQRESDIPKRIRLIIETIKTKNSIDINVLLAAVRSSISIVAFGWHVKNVYEYLKKESKEKRYVGRRYHLNRIIIRRIKRTYIEKEKKEEIEEEFELEFKKERI